MVKMMINTYTSNNIKRLGKIFFLVPLIFMFFCPSLGLGGIETFRLPLYYLLFPIFLGFILIINPIKFFKQIINLFRKRPSKYLMYLFVWIFVVSIINYFIGRYGLSLHKIFNRFFFTLFINIICVFLYCFFVMQISLTIKNLIKFLCTAYMFIFIFGIVQFLGAFFNITFIQNLSLLIGNLSNIFYSDGVCLTEFSTITRVYSVFREPGLFASFIAINMPIIYQITKSKFKIYKNNLLNLVIKKTIIVLMIINLLLTQSPIYFIICLVISLCFYINDIKYFILKHYNIFILLVTFFVVINIFFIFFTDINLKETFLIRIINVISLLFNFSLDKFLEVEASLATRVICYYQQILLWLKHPIIGIGYGNLGYIVINQLQNSSIVLTPEIIYNLEKSKDTLTSLNTNVFYTLLYQTGIVGTIIYIFYMIKNINILKKIENLYIGIEKDFCIGIRKTVAVILLLSIIYNINLAFGIMVYLGISTTLIFNAKQHRRKIIQ